MIRKTPCVLIIVHAHGHNDGGIAITQRIAEKYPQDYRKSTHTRIEEHKNTRTPGTIYVEGGFPRTSGEIAGYFRIAPQDVTHVLLIVDANVFQFDEYGTRLTQMVTENGATAIGLGNVWNFDPVSKDATSMDTLGARAKTLVNYIEQYLRLPVVFLATGLDTCIDREPFRMHEEPDPTVLIAYGATE